MRRRGLLGGAMALGAAPARAQSFPARPVRLVIPFATGGSLNVLGNAIGESFQAGTGQALVLDNRPGAGGTVATEQVVRSAPDGYTLLLASAGQVTIAPALYPGLAYDPRTDLVPIAYLMNTPMTLFAGNAFPARSLAEVLAAARARPEQITFASPGIGSVGHLAMELMAQVTGTRWTHVPYRGAAPALNDLVAGQVNLTFTTVASAKPLLDAGLIRAIAIAATQRSAVLPDLPTFGELGAAGVVVPVWYGVMAPRGTPPAVRERLGRAFLGAMADPNVRAVLTGLGADIVAQGPDEFARMLEAEYPVWAEVVRRGGITVN